MSNKSGYQSLFSSINVWGSGPVLSTLRITGKSILNILEVIGNTLFKGFVYFSDDVHFENLPTSSVYSPTEINQFATKQYVDSVFVGEGIDIFDSNNTWSGTNTWEDTCTFDMGQFKFFSIGTEENVVAGINTFSTETRFSANAMNINGEEYVYITGAGDVTIKGGGFGAPNPEGGGLIGGTLNITSALTTLESSTAITIEATNITITGAVESASITEEIGLAVEVEEERAVAAELALEEEMVVMQGEIETLQGEIAGIAVGGGGIVAGLETQILSLQNTCQNNTGGGHVKTSEITFYQKNGSGNFGSLSMVEREGQTKLHFSEPVDFDKSIYLDTGAYLSSHGDVDIRNGQKAFKGNYLRAFYHTEHPLHIGTDAEGGDGEVWIEGTINLFTKSIPRMKTTLSLVPTMDNELSTKFYVDTSITNGLTIAGAVTLGGDQTLLDGVKTFTNLPVCSTFASNQNQFTTKGSVESILSNTLSSYVTLSGAQTFLTGVKTFTDLPECTVVPTNNAQFVNKLYVDNAISSVGGGGSGDVTTNTAQVISGEKTFTASTTKFGDVVITESTPRVAILNNTILDSSVSGTFGNESVYHQIQFGSKQTYISQGVDSDNTYIGQSDGTSPDPNFQLTLRRGVGLKISGSGTNTDAFTEALKVNGTQRVTGISTFEVCPECPVSATSGNQLTNKTYVDNAISTAGTPFVTLSTAQDNISGAKTFTGNCVIWPTSGTTVIRGSQADIFADVTFLTGGTTTISGNNCNIIGSNTYFGGALLSMRSTTINIGLVKTNPLIDTFCYLQAYKVIVDSNVYSFYVDAAISNFVGDETLLQSPTTRVSNLCTNLDIESQNTNIKSPSFTVTSSCTNFNVNATSTNFSGTVVAPTVVNTDNSTKVATTAFVNSYGNANYMTIGTNQSISGGKTYSSKQTFSAGADIGGVGVTSNFTGGINVPDQAVGENSTLVANTKFVNSRLNAALANYVTIAGNQDVTGFKNFTKVVSTPVETSFVNLNTHTDPYAFFPMTRKFIFNYEYYTQDILLSENYVAGYSSKFSIEAHYLLFDAEPSATIDLTQPLEVNYYVYDNTLSQTFTSPTLRFGIPSNYLGVISVPPPGQTWRFVGNFDNTYDKNCFFERALIAGHSYTFSYKITASAVYATGSFSVSSNFRYRVETTRSIESVNYNYFCNPYSCFLKNVFCGAWMIEGSGSTATRIPLYYSCVDASNVFGTITLAFEPQIQLTSYDIANNGAVGEISYYNIDNTDNNYEIYPNYGLVVYQQVNYNGEVYLNYKNTGKNPIWVRPSIINRISSYRVFYMDKEILRNDEVMY